MTKKTLNISNLANELEGSKFFAHKRGENQTEQLRTGVQVNSNTPEQANKRTHERDKDLIGDKTVRKPFNIFEEHDARIDWYVAQKKRSGNGSYNRSELVRDLLDKFFEREKKRGKMKGFSEQVNG